MSTARDTQFAGWAKLVHDEQKALWEKAFDEGWIGSSIDQFQIEALARRAYDFAKHTMSNVTQGMAAENEGGPKYLEENMRYIPDMTELPKEQSPIDAIANEMIHIYDPFRPSCGPMEVCATTSDGKKYTGIIQRTDGDYIELEVEEVQEEKDK